MWLSGRERARERERERERLGFQAQASKRTNSIVREHILYSGAWRRAESLFCSKRTHSIVREHIL